MAAVAVLLMNIENTEMMMRNPSSTIFGLVPKMLSNDFARVTSSPNLSAMIASTNPPRNSITTGSAKDDIIFL